MGYLKGIFGYYLYYFEEISILVVKKGYLHGRWLSFEKTED